MEDQALNEAMAAEGWALIDVNAEGLYEIQRDDEANIFETDEDALEHVRRLADRGSKPHMEAMKRHAADADQLKAGREHA